MMMSVAVMIGILLASMHESVRIVKVSHISVAVSCRLSITDHAGPRIG